MKTYVKSTIILLVGLAVGFYTGYHYYEKHITNLAVRQMLAEMESSAGEQAARATRAIELVEAGETQKAVQMLSGPIADYYCLYAIDSSTETERKLRALIEQLTSTNQIVAVAITNEMKYRH